MKKIKNIVLLVVLLLTICMVTSCKGKPKTFTSHGITVTLTSKFKPKEVQGAQVVYIANKVGFMGNQESKSALYITDGKLEEYTKKVLNVSNMKNLEYNLYEKDGVKFYYAYYNASVQNLEYRYMLITKEGKNSYYTMNFWSFTKTFNKYQDQFMEWAKLIEVE